MVWVKFDGWEESLLPENFFSSMGEGEEFSLGAGYGDSFLLG